MTDFNFGNTIIEPDTDSGNADFLCVFSAVLPKAGTLQSVSFYIESGAGNLVLGVYDASTVDDRPNNLLAKSNPISLTGISNQWVTLSMITPVSLNPGQYWIGYSVNNNSCSFRHGQRDGYGQGRVATYTYDGSLPSSWTPANEVGNGLLPWSLYATITLGTQPSGARYVLAPDTDVAHAVTSKTTSVTPGSVTNGMLVVVVGEYHIGGSAPSFTWGGSSSGVVTVQSSAIDDGGTNARRLTIFRKLLGTGTIGATDGVVTWSGSISEAFISYHVIENVDQTTPTGTPVLESNHLAGTKVNVVASVANGLVFDAIVLDSIDNSCRLGGTGQVMACSVTAGNETEGGAQVYPGTGSNISATFTTNADNSVHIGFLINPSSSEAPVSQTQASRYEIAQGITKSGVNQFEAAGKTQAPISTQLEAQQSVNQTQQDQLEIVKGVLQTQAKVYEAVKGLQPTQTVGIEAIGMLLVSTNTQIENIQSLINSQSANFETLRGIVQSRAQSYESLLGILKAIVTQYEALAASGGGSGEVLTDLYAEDFDDNVLDSPGYTDSTGASDSSMTIIDDPTGAGRGKVMDYHFHKNANDGIVDMNLWVGVDARAAGFPTHFFFQGFVYIPASTINFISDGGTGTASQTARKLLYFRSTDGFAWVVVTMWGNSIATSVLSREGESVDWDVALLNGDSWNKIRVEIQINSAWNVADGFFRLWVNDMNTPALEKLNIFLWEGGATQQGDPQLYNDCGVGYQREGNSDENTVQPVIDEHRYWDDLRFGTALDGGSAVSQTQQSWYEIMQRIVASASASMESAGPISNTGVVTTENEQGIRQTRDVQIENELSVSQATATVYEAIQALLATSSVIFEHLLGIAKSQQTFDENGGVATSPVSNEIITCFEALGIVAQTQDVQDETLGFVAQAQAAGLESEGIIVSSQKTLIEVLQTLFVQSATPLEILESVVIIIPIAYEADGRGAGTPSIVVAKLKISLALDGRLRITTAHIGSLRITPN